MNHVPRVGALASKLALGMTFASQPLSLHLQSLTVQPAAVLGAAAAVAAGEALRR